MKKIASLQNPDMKLIKRKNSHYLLVKLNARDKKYLDGFRKYEPPKHVQNINKVIDLKGNRRLKNN